MSKRTHYIQAVSVILICGICYTWLLYNTPRSSFYLLFGLFLALFSLSYVLIRNETRYSFEVLVGAGILFRLIALFNVPNLTDDYFRFIWDGKMIVAHINPFHFTPEQYLAAHYDQYLQLLYERMNSQKYHSIYPPLMQYVFCAAAWLFPKNVYGSIFVMKLFILLAELLSISLLYKLAKRNIITTQNALWYILNPLIIVELTGNIHFEALMICGLIYFFYFLSTKKWIPAAVCFGLAVISKWIPLMLLPLLFRYLPWKIFTRLLAVTLFMLLISFSPFIQNGLVTGLSASFRLFYHLFEFNASIFYLIREAGYHFRNYDVIEETAPWLGAIATALILLISWWPARKYSCIEKSLWIFSIYFAFSTMMHPWYCSILILFASLSRFKYPVFFSLLIILSYYPYSLAVYEENMTVILFEYLLLLACIIYEIRTIKPVPGRQGASVF